MDTCTKFKPNPSQRDVDPLATPGAEAYCARCGAHAEEHADIEARSTRRALADLAYATRPISEDEWETDEEARS